MNYKLIILEDIKLALIYYGNDLLNLTIEHHRYPLNKVYLGRISNVLPSLNAAFIQLDSSREKNGFIDFDKLKKEQLKNWVNSPIKNKHFLVQITREPVCNKGPTVSSNVVLKGRYLSLYPFQESNYQEKKTYNTINKKYLYALKCLLSPTKSSVCVSFKAMNADANFLVEEVESLKNTWTALINKSKLSSLPASPIRKSNFLSNILKNYTNIKFSSIHVDSYKGSLKIKKILSKIELYRYSVSGKTKIHYHLNKINLIKQLSLDLILSDLTKPRINLYTGGYIIIEKTEALTTIDINSGSFKSLPNSRQTSLWINYLAIHEIAKQIKLRNIGGIIIIDFIDSNNQYDQMKLLKYINKLLKKDETKCNIIQISELGLLELTRTRQGQSIYDAFTSKCKICNGLGYKSNRLNAPQLSSYSLLLSFSPLFLKN